MLAHPTINKPLSPANNRRPRSITCRSSSPSLLPKQEDPSPATMATTGVSAFLSQHDLQAKIEDALNRCVKSKPDEPLSFLVRFFCSFFVGVAAGASFLFAFFPIADRFCARQWRRRA
jgi:hypothetical protein